VHVYTESGIYDVTLEIQDFEGNMYSSSKDDYIQINSVIEDMNFIAIPTSGSAPLLVNFNEDCLGNIDIYEWKIIPGPKLYGSQVNYQFNDPGSYDVMLTCHNAQYDVSSSIIKENYIEVFEGTQNLSANFYGEPLTGKFPLTVNFYEQIAGQYDEIT